MATTTQITIRDTGGTDVLEYEDVDMPQPGKGEIRVAVEAIGVGFGEVLYREGRYVQETKLPSLLGNNAVGTVDALGEGVDTVSVGDRIAIIPSFQMNEYGVYAKHAIVPAYSAAPYFDELSLEENASIWIQAITPYGALVMQGGLTEDDFVFLMPASGSVGQAAIELVKAMGATSITTTRTQEKVAMLKEVGADHVIVTEDEDLVGRVDEITDGKGARLIFMALTGDIMETLVNDIVSESGTIFMYGGIGAHDTPLPYPKLISRWVTIKGYTLYEITYHPENLDALRDYVVDGVKKGTITANVDRTFRFEEMADAHAYLEGGSTKGSVIALV